MTTKLSKKEREDIKGFFKLGYIAGETDLKKKLLKLINEQRDNGNTLEDGNHNGRGFSASLCLSDIIKELEK